MGEWIKKLLAVIFLTLLIWAWAFLSLEIDHHLIATLKIAPVAEQDRLIRFNQDQQVDLRLKFKGAPPQIAELQQKYRNEKMEFFYDPKEFGHIHDEQYQLNVFEFIRTNPKIKEYALTLESSSPETIDITVENLVEKMLVVQCLDETGNIIKHESIEPAQIEMYVRKDYNGAANVTLTAQQLERARKQPITEKPYVEITPGKRKFAAVPATITLPASDPLEPRTLQPPQIGYLMSAAMMNKYKVELLNDKEFLTIPNIRATEKAFEAFNKQKFHIYIEIRDDDQPGVEIPPRQVKWNFPAEYFKSGQIEAPATPLQARIRLMPLTPSMTTTPPTQPLSPLPGG